MDHVHSSLLVYFRNVNNTGDNWITEKHSSNKIKSIQYEQTEQVWLLQLQETSTALAEIWHSAFTHGKEHNL